MFIILRMKFSSASLLSIASLYLLLHTPVLAQTTGVDPLAPTHDTKSAAEIDREWQVSVSKYDGAREAILREVDRQGNDEDLVPQFQTPAHPSPRGN
jgi:hypothetical protein